MCPACIIFDGMKMRAILFCAGLLFLTGCGVSKSSFSPSKKFPPQKLQKDYAIYRQILEEAHPGLYWYQQKDSMDLYFEYGRRQLNDSLTEPQFRKVLAWVTSRINCGHTSVRASKRYSRFVDTSRVSRLFPLSLKIWDDTAIVTSNLDRQSPLVRGTMVRKIDGVPIERIIDSMFSYISTDGYNTTHKYQTLSNRGYFGSLYTSLYGYSRDYNIEYTDSSGITRHTTLKTYRSVHDTTNRAALRAIRSVPQPSRRERRMMRKNAVRFLKIDSTNETAMLDLNSFGRGYGLKSFFRKSFRHLRKNKVDHLIIDVRGNGGGSVTNSTSLTRYITDHRFKVADSLYAIAKRKKYSRYIKNDFFNRLFMTFFTPRQKDGNYHFRYFEKTHFKPKKKNHFNGKVYVLTGGNSFSATTLFASSLIKQDNVTIVGEETGGGAYGNSAWLIPDVTLPETKVRFRLPLFRLVIDKDYPKTGKGVQPEVLSKPSIRAIKEGIDYKMETAMELIKKNKEVQQPAAAK